VGRLFYAQTSRITITKVMLSLTNIPL
jgi:hypothetical protein